MASRKQTGKAKSRPQAKLGAPAVSAVEAAVQTEEPELALQATPLKTSRNSKRASGSQSPNTVAQLMSPEVERKDSSAWSQESYEEPLVYEPHASIPLDPDSQEALAMISENMVPLDLQRRGSSIAREFSLSREAEDRACANDDKEQLTLDQIQLEEEEEEKFEVQLAVDDEQLGNEYEWVTIDRAVAQAVQEEHIEAFLREVPKLKWNKHRHKFERGRMYAGFIFYGSVFKDRGFIVDHDNRKFSPGSVAIRRTDIASVQNAVSRESGLIHPQAFAEAFGLKRYPSNLVAEAFALGPLGSFERAARDRAFGDSAAGETLCEGVEIRFNSSFNSSRARGGDRPGRDESRQMSPRMQRMLVNFLQESDWLRGVGGDDPEPQAEAKAAGAARVERKQAKSRKNNPASNQRWVKKQAGAETKADTETTAAAATPPSPAESKQPATTKGKCWVEKKTGAETKTDTETTAAAATSPSPAECKQSRARKGKSESNQQRNVAKANVEKKADTETKAPET